MNKHERMFVMDNAVDLLVPHSRRCCSVTTATVEDRQDFLREVFELLALNSSVDIKLRDFIS